ncbi:MAG: beta-phosphoglucomutase family hydrolase [Bacteroidales bacterium]|nr:beta-phosphoglucomutase family hydrolase [Bacteroidales bacterium]
MSFVLPDGIKALIFDLDGTLADTMPLHMKAWREACNSYGMDMSSEFLRSFTGSPGINIARAIIKESSKEGVIDPHDIVSKKRIMFNDLQHMVKEIGPVADIVRKYHDIIPLAVGTGGPRDIVMHTLEVIDMKKYFRHVVTADDVKNHKPDPETFFKCAELLEVAPSDIIVFEDGDLGIRAAKSAGMQAVDVRGWYEYSW